MIETTLLDGYTILDYGNDTFNQLEKYWRQLERGADMTAFQSYDWYKGLQPLYAKERTKNLFRKWRYILLLRDSQPVLIAPLEIKSFGIGYKNYGSAVRGVYFIGRMGFTDYLNFIYDSFDPRAVNTLLAYVADKYRQSRFCFDRMLESSECHRYLSEVFSAEKEPVHCAALVFPDSFDTYKTSLSKSTRQNIRTAINRANKNGITLRHELIFDEGEDVKEILLRLCNQRSKKKNANSKKEMSFAGSVYVFFANIFRRLFCAKLDVIRASKNTFSFLVKDGERIVSFFWGIRNIYLNEYYIILVSVDPEYEWYSPNISHLYLFMEEYYKECRQDIRMLDFTRGAEGYKKTIGCTTRPVSTLRFRYK